VFPARHRWRDPTLDDWPENDYRIFVGELGNELNDDALAKAFQKYPSFAKARVRAHALPAFAVSVPAAGVQVDVLLQMRAVGLTAPFAWAQDQLAREEHEEPSAAPCQPASPAAAPLSLVPPNHIRACR